MKRYKKVLLAVAGCLTLAGGVVMVTGIAMGGRLSMWITSTGKVITGEQRGKFIEKKEALKNVKSIELLADDGDLYIEQGEELCVEYGYDELFIKPTLEYKGEKAVLTLGNIDQGGMISMWGFGDYGSWQQKNYVRLILPKDAGLEQVKLVSDYGDVSLAAGEIRKLVVDSAYGKVHISNMDMEKVALDMEEGELGIEDCTIAELNVQNESGSDHMRLNNLVSNEVTLNTGYMNLDLENIQTGTLDIKSENGNIVLQNITGAQGKKRVEDLTVNNQYGNLMLKDVKAERFSLLSEDGNFDLTGMTAGNMNVKTDYGYINGKEITAREVNIRQENGNCVLDALDSKDTKIQNSYGKVELDLEKSEKEYDFYLNTDDGRTEINGTEYGDIYTKERDGKNKVRVDDAAELVVHTKE